MTPTSKVLILFYAFLLVFSLKVENVNDLVKNTGSICHRPKSWNGIHMSSFARTGAHYSRMFLELYFSRPLLVRSFFHQQCKGDFLLLHHNAPVYAENSIYVKRNLYDTVVSNCMQLKTENAKSGLKFDEIQCAEWMSKQYAEHVISSIIMASGQVDKQLTIVEPERLKNGDYFEELLNNMRKRNDVIIQFNATRHQTVAETLSEKTVRERTKDAGGRVSETTKFQMAERRNFLSLTKDFISISFASEWDEAHIDEMFTIFTELPRRDKLENLGLGLPGAAAISTMKPDVHVLIPTKNPANMTRCIKALLDNADISFGKVNFHFGLDWNDDKTKKLVSSVCQTLEASCEYHEVYERGGDISGIVNYMFATIDENAYFFRYNDDTEMVTKDWNSKAIRALRKQPVDVGIAFIVDKTNPTLQTHSFVSSVHKNIFSFYFPQHFKNIYEDNWITSVYKGALSKKSYVTIIHHAKGVRYQALHVPQDMLAIVVDKGKSRISRYVNENFKHVISKAPSFFGSSLVTSNPFVAKPVVCSPGSKRFDGKVFDAFLFSNENDILEARFYELFDVVDVFIVGETKISFTGKPRELNFERDVRFAPFKSKIRYVKIDEATLKGCSGTDRSAAFSCEAAARNALKTAMYDLEDDDLVLVSDVDEIPSLSRIAEYRKCGAVVPKRLELRTYHYSLHWRLYKANYFHVSLCDGAYVKKEGIQSCFRDAGGDSVPNSGWHMSYFGSPQWIQEKLATYAETQTNVHPFNTYEYILDHASRGVDLLERDIFETRYVASKDLEGPWFALTNRKLRPSFHAYKQENDLS